MVGAGAVLAGVVYWKLRGKTTQQVASNISSGIVGGAVGAVGGAATGIVESIGGVVGIPETNTDKCAAAKAAGDTWGASFACPAGDFIGWWWNK